MACRKALASSPDSMTATVQLFGLLHSAQQHPAALEVLQQAQKRQQQQQQQQQHQVLSSSQATPSEQKLAQV